MTVERRDVTFKSAGSFAAGWFFLPEGAALGARVPAVALAPGTGGVKELFHEPFARRFAEAGVAALLFDYRSFGASGGEPRQRLFPRDQIEDYRSALTWLSLQPEIDAGRLGVWGASLSGGHVLHVAAYDPRVKAVVSTEGPIDIYRMLRAAAGKEKFAAMEQLTVQERVRRAAEGGEVYVPNVASSGHQGFAYQTDSGSKAYFPVSSPGIASSWRNELTMSSLEALLEYAPGRSIELIAPRPLLMMLGTEDTNTSPGLTRDVFDKVSDAAAEWFAHYLGA